MIQEQIDGIIEQYTDGLLAWEEARNAIILLLADCDEKSFNDFILAQG